MKNFSFLIVLSSLLFLTGCPGAGQQLNCLTRNSVERALKENRPLQEVALGSYSGVISLYDPDNPWTKSKITKRACTFAVGKNEKNQYIVTASFLNRPVVLSIPLSGINFYMGKIDDDHMLVLQQHHRGASLSHINFDEENILAYGACSRDGYFVQQCDGS